MPSLKVVSELRRTLLVRRLLAGSKHVNVEGVSFKIFLGDFLCLQALCTERSEQKFRGHSKEPFLNLVAIFSSASLFPLHTLYFRSISRFCACRYMRVYFRRCQSPIILPPPPRVKMWGPDNRSFIPFPTLPCVTISLVT